MLKLKLKLVLCAALGAAAVVAAAIPAVAAIDKAPPVLVPGTFMFTPGSVDVTSGGQVDVTAQVTDASGVVPPVVTLSSDTTTQTIRTTLTPGAGATYQASVVIPATAARGSWTVTLDPLQDTVGHSESAGHVNPVKLTVVNGNTLDVTPPVVVPGSLTFTPSAANVTTGPKQVTVTARVTDATGVVPPAVNLTSDASTQSVRATMTLDPGAAQPDTYTTTVDIPTNAAPGPWTVSLDPVRDTIGNVGSALASPTKLTVTSGSSDISAPVLVPGTFSFSPGTTDASTDLSKPGGAVVTVTARVTDATGAEPPVPNLRYDATGQSASGAPMRLVSGTPQDGTYEGTVNLPATAAPGTWTVSLAALQDPLGNTDRTVHNHPTKLTVLNEDAPLAPAAPTAVVATRGDGTAQVAWTPGAPNRSPITGFVVTASPGGATATAGANATSTSVPGLINGIAYTFTVKATNAIGISLPSTPSNAVTPAGRPGAPTGITAARGDKSAQVSWTAPPPNGALITEYTITASPGNATLKVAGTASSGIVPGLTNGTSYTFTVAATNVAGTSPVSATSNAVVPAAVPGPPTAVAATRGDKSVQLSWVAAASNGFPVTGYTVTASPGGATRTVGGTTTSLTFTGLTNGTAYTFTVTATNATGIGPVSLPSAAVTPAIAPAAPTAVVGVAADKSVQVSWTAAVNNGAPVTSYTITANPGGATKTVAGDVTTGTVTGLTNGTGYTFTVTATNAVGTSPASAPSAVVTPSALPAAPTGVVATRGDGTAQVDWTPPVTNGAAITGYTVTVSPGGATVTVPGDLTTATVTGLSNVAAYSFTVTATNAAGTSPASAPSNTLPPAGAPSAPSGVTASPGDRSAQVSWTAASPNGAPISGYVITARPGGATQTVTGTSAVVTGLANGTAYTFTVRAVNAIGTSPSSAASSAVVPAGTPGRVLSPTATVQKRTVTFRWRAAAPHGSPVTGYTVTSPQGPSVTVNGQTLTARLKKLAPGTYTFVITARNAIGVGTQSRAIKVRIR